MLRRHPARVKASHVLCAAPAYIEQHGSPRAPADLARHACIAYGLSTSPARWTFEGPRGPVEVSVRGRLVLSNSLAVRDAVLAAGVGLLPSFYVHAELADGRLVASCRTSNAARHHQRAVRGEQVAAAQGACGGRFSATAAGGGAVGGAEGGRLTPRRISASKGRKRPSSRRSNLRSAARSRRAGRGRECRAIRPGSSGVSRGRASP